MAVDSRGAGKIVRCPGCNEKFQIPSESTVAPSEGQLTKLEITLTKKIEEIQSQQSVQQALVDSVKSQLSDQVSVLRGDVEAVSKNAPSSDLVNNLEKELRELKTSVDSYTSRDALQPDAESLKKLEETLSQKLHQSAEQQQQQVSEIRQKLDTFKKDIQGDTESNVQALTSDLKSQLDSLQRDLDTKGSSYEIQAKGELEERRKSLAALKRDLLTETTSKVDDLKSGVESKIKSLEHSLKTIPTKSEGESISAIEKLRKEWDHRFTEHQKSQGSNQSKSSSADLEKLRHQFDEQLKSLETSFQQDLARVKEPDQKQLRLQKRLDELEAGQLSTEDFQSKISQLEQRLSGKVEQFISTQAPPPATEEPIWKGEMAQRLDHLEKEIKSAVTKNTSSDNKEVARMERKLQALENGLLEKSTVAIPFKHVASKQAAHSVSPPQDSKIDSMSAPTTPVAPQRPRSFFGTIDGWALSGWLLLLAGILYFSMTLGNFYKTIPLFSLPLVCALIALFRNKSLSNIILLINTVIIPIFLALGLTYFRPAQVPFMKEQLNPSASMLEELKDTFQSFVLGEPIEVDGIFISLSNPRIGHVKEIDINGEEKELPQEYLLVDVLLENKNPSQSVHIHQAWKNTKLIDDTGIIYRTAFVQRFSLDEISGTLTSVTLQPTKKIEDMIIFERPENLDSNFTIHSDPGFWLQSLNGGIRPLSKDLFRITVPAGAIRQSP